MKTLSKILLTLTALATSAPSFAYMDWAATLDIMSNREIRNFEITPKTDMEEKLRYTYSKFNNAYVYRDLEGMNDAIEEMKLWRKEGDARASFSLALFLKRVDEVKCEDEDYVEICLEPVNEEIVNYFKEAVEVDVTNRSAGALADYYISRRTDEAYELGKVWATKADEIEREYRSGWVKGVGFPQNLYKLKQK